MHHEKPSPIVYIEAAHRQGLSGALTGARVVKLVVVAAPHRCERDLRRYGLREEHVGAIVRAESCNKLAESLSVQPKRGFGSREDKQWRKNTQCSQFSKNIAC